MYVSPILKDQAGLVHGYSDVGDGNMDLRFGHHETVLESRRAFLGKLGLSLEDCAQQRGMEDKIHVVTHSDLGAGMTTLGTSIEANAFITNQKGVGLFLCIADCLPVIIYDPAKRVVALLHAARESTKRHLATKVVEHLTTEFECEPRDLLVAFGPAVRAESYVFDEGIYKLVGKDWEPYLHEVSPGKIQVDYVAYNYDQLLAAGVPADHIHDPGIDTGSDPNYFSHVQSVKTGRPEARIAAAVALR